MVPVMTILRLLGWTPPGVVFSLNGHLCDTGVSDCYDLSLFFCFVD
jgi:hypothetical protein